MLDSAASPETEAAPEAEEALTGQPEAEAEIQENEAPEGDGQPDDELEEFEYEGKRYQAPKALKEAAMRHVDYTQKTMKLAEEFKGVEITKKQVAEYKQSVEADFEDLAELKVLDKRLEQWGKVNWDQMFDSDLVEATKLDRQYRADMDARHQLAQRLTQRQGERSFKAQQETAKREEEGRAALMREIKGYSPERESKLREHAVSRGVPEAAAKEFKFALDPVATKILNDSYELAQLKKQLAKKTDEQPVIKPATKLPAGKQSSAPSEFRSDMTDAQFDAWRARQRNKKRQ
jgi:hypothetical protein